MRRWIEQERKIAREGFEIFLHTERVEQVKGWWLMNDYECEIHYYSKKANKVINALS